MRLLYKQFSTSALFKMPLSDGSDLQIKNVKNQVKFGYKVKYINNSSLVLKTEGFLESCWFPSVASLKKLLITRKECHSKRIHEIPERVEASRQMYNFLLPFPFVWVTTRRCHIHFGWSFCCKLFDPEIPS